MGAVIEVTVGDKVAKIYEILNRGKKAFQVSYGEAGERKRITRTKLSLAKAEARRALGPLASVNPEIAKLESPDFEALVLARRHLQGLDIPVHIATETYAKVAKLLEGDGKPAGSATIIEACQYYLTHGFKKITRPLLSTAISEFLASREEGELGREYKDQCKVALRTLLNYIPDSNTDLPKAKILGEWMVKRHPVASTRNTNLRVLKTFGLWLVKAGYAAVSPFAEIEKWKVKARPVVIYSPQELEELLRKVTAGVKTYIALAAFAGMRRAEIFRLDWKDVKLDRGYITVGVDKAKTQSRRLVPISANLRAWLEPLKQDSGPVVDYDPRYMSSTLRKAGAGSSKRNALRHSYISYRLAETQDVGKVALESGNSPAVIFSSYLEAVTPEEAKLWGSIVI